MSFATEKMLSMLISWPKNQEKPDKSLLIIVIVSILVNFESFKGSF